MKDDIATFVFALMGAILIGCAGLLVAAWIVMLGWNWSMPQLFSLPEASYRNALGLALLAGAARSACVLRSKEG